MARSHDQSLYAEAAAGSQENVSLALDHGANIHWRNPRENGRMPLHIAARYGHAAVVRYLLDRGADIDATTNNNSTSLQIAARHGHELVVRLLLERGADTSAVSVCSFICWFEDQWSF